MALIYVVKPSIDLYQIDDSNLAAYQAAGWTQATGPQIAAWAAADPYGGMQGAPPAPTVPGTTLPATDTEQAN